MSLISKLKYQKRLKEEINTYKNVIDIHQLPDIFHYWSNKYLRPLIETYGFSTINDIYIHYLKQSCDEKSDGKANFVSIGAGNCEIEIAITHALVQEGYTNFTFSCIDINQSMLNRAQANATEKKVDQYMSFDISDLNEWTSSQPYDIIFAFQCLHHFVELEEIFTNIKTNLGEFGKFIYHDMIGRNGHMRWPECKSIIDELWKELPDSYKYNHQLKRLEKTFLDWDCSKEGFEGIRAQDILPQLSKMFKTELFIYWGGLIDVFIDRGFGYNFDAKSDVDKAFIDKVEFINRDKILSREIKPTQTICVMQNHLPDRKFHLYGLSPKDCVRVP